MLYIMYAGTCTLILSSFILSTGNYVAVSELSINYGTVIEQVLHGSKHTAHSCSDKKCIFFGKVVLKVCVLENSTSAAESINSI